MSRVGRYLFFFFLSGLIHLFLCVDFLKLKNHIPQIDAGQLLEKLHTMVYEKEQNQSTEENTLNTKVENKVKSNIDEEDILFANQKVNPSPTNQPIEKVEFKSSQKNQKISSQPKELVSEVENKPISSSVTDKNALLSHSTTTSLQENPFPLREEANLDTPLSVVVFGEALLSSDNFIENAKEDGAKNAIIEALKQLNLPKPYNPKLFEEPFQFIRNYSVVEIQEKENSCVVKLRVLINIPALQQAQSEVAKEEKKPENIQKTTLEKEVLLETDISPNKEMKVSRERLSFSATNKIQTLSDYKNYLANWMVDFKSNGRPLPKIRLISDSTIKDLARRQHTQNYRVICYPIQQPEYYVSVDFDANNQLSFERRVDTYAIQTKYSKRTLKEKTPLFERLKTEIGSKGELYHVRDGKLSIVQLVPQKVDRYLTFKQQLAATQLGLNLEDIQICVGSFRETVFDYDIFVISGVLTKDGKKLYPKDPELELVELKS